MIEQGGLEYYNGIITPGFVNSHCNLELSHLKGKIEEKTGIGGFVAAINRLRNNTETEIEKDIRQADHKMWAAGISVVGDISNSTITIEAKLKSRIYYHTFVESFGFHPSRTERAFDIAQFVQFSFRNRALSNSIVPHSPYSVSKPLFEKIRDNALAEKSILSLHNQESKSETEFYKTGTGAIAKHLTDNLGIDISHWQPSGKSSLASVMEYLPAENQLLLVHNTYTTKEDIDFLKKNRRDENTWLVLCPNSNLFIENQMPPVNLFRNEKMNICLGTDSLASNHELSILAEIGTIQQHFAEVTLEELVRWASFNGAQALQVEDIYGSIETGKKPGINLITGIDFRNMKLTEKSSVKRLV